MIIKIIFAEFLIIFLHFSVSMILDYDRKNIKDYFNYKIIKKNFKETIIIILILNIISILFIIIQLIIGL